MDLMSLFTADGNILLRLILYSIAYLVLAFIVVFKSRRQAKGTILEWPVLILLVVPFIIFDWVVNLTAFTILCLDLPAKWNELSTARMRRYKINGNAWQRLIANTLCRIVNTVDREHC